jgi:hypothetical protein
MIHNCKFLILNTYTCFFKTNNQSDGNSEAVDGLEYQDVEDSES